MTTALLCLLLAAPPGAKPPPVFKPHPQTETFYKNVLDALPEGWKVGRPSVQADGTESHFDFSCPGHPAGRGYANVFLRCVRTKENPGGRWQVRVVREGAYREEDGSTDRDFVWEKDWAAKTDKKDSVFKFAEKALELARGARKWEKEFP